MIQDYDGGSTDTSDDEPTLVWDESSDSISTTSTDSDSTDSTSSDDDDNRTPTGIQNPFNWQTDDGDVVAPPEDHVSDDGDVAGSETVVEDDGSLDINPLGDEEVDPSDQDYESDPTDDQGAQERDSPDTALTTLTREVGAEEALDQIGSAMVDATGEEALNEPVNVGGQEVHPMLLLAAGLTVGGAAYYVGGE